MCSGLEAPLMHSTHQVIAAAAPTLARMFSRWVHHLGGLGFIPLGLIDSSVIPLPGSMDILTIVLAARQAQLWPYYAIMATVGSVLGGYLTYRLARKGGKDALERHFSHAQVIKVNKLFARWGFGALAIPAILPPPVPMVPFLFAAGALQYSVGKFLAALTLGRIIRYSVLGYLAARYGRQMVVFIRQNGHPILLAALGAIGLTVGIFIYFRYGKGKSSPRRAA